MTNVNLMLGDCLERMSEIPDGSVDMILADLPYGTTACKWDVVIPFEPLWAHYWRVLRCSMPVLLFGSEPFSTLLRSSQITAYRYDWYWHKRFAGNFVQAKRMPLKTIETISVFSQNKMPSYFPIKTLREKPIKIGKNSTYEAIPISQTDYARSYDKKEYQDKMPETLIKFNVRENRGKHPTQKPVALLEYLIRTYTNEGETVLDNVMGSGSTGVACLNTQRKFIGIEKDATYFEIAKKRIGESLG